MRARLPISTRRITDRIVQCAHGIPRDVGGLAPHEMIRLLRTRLHMSQAQLARRAKMPQSHLARIENGEGDPQWSTLRRIFEGLGCRLIVVPQTERNLNRVVAARIEATARRRIAQLAGSMSLEKQRPDDASLRDLLRTEIRRLKANPTSEIWEE